MRYGGDERTRDDGSLDEDSYSGGPSEHGAELFVDAGMNVNQVHTDLEPGIPITTSQWGFDPHFGLGARRAVSANNDLGVRLEARSSRRPLADRRPRPRLSISLHRPFALGLFVGVARYNLATPAYSIYFGSARVA